MRLADGHGLIAAPRISQDLYQVYHPRPDLITLRSVTRDSKPESATLRGQNITLSRRLRHSIPRLYRSPGLTVDFKKTFIAVAAVDALGDCIGAVFASQWKRYPVLA